MTDQQRERIAQEKYNEEWIKASYEVLGWCPSPILTKEDFLALDIACGEHEIQVNKPNPPWFYENQIVKAVIEKLKDLVYTRPAEPNPTSIDELKVQPVDVVMENQHNNWRKEQEQSEHLSVRMEVLREKIIRILNPVVIYEVLKYTLIPQIADQILKLCYPESSLGRMDAIKTELKIFGCQWGWIKDKPGADIEIDKIADESAREILKLAEMKEGSDSTKGEA